MFLQQLIHIEFLFGFSLSWWSSWDQNLRKQKQKKNANKQWMCFLGCPEKVQVSLLIPIPITRYLLFTLHCVGRVKSNPECKHKVNKFESDKALIISLGIFQTHVFRFFFPGIIFEISPSTWMIQSILPFLSSWC